MFVGGGAGNVRKLWMNLKLSVAGVERKFTNDFHSGGTCCFRNGIC